MPGRRSWVALATATACAALMLSAAQAGAFIYWADFQGQAIGRAANEGSGVEVGFIHTSAGPIAVSVDSAHIYWANENSGSIGRANIDGSGVDNSFITGLSQPSGVVVNGSSVFWSTLGGPIGRADIDGANVKPAFVTGPAESCGVALDSGHVYWVDIAGGIPAYIGRASLDGGFKQLQYATLSEAFPCGVAVNTNSIYWADGGFFGGGTRIGRANTNDGKGVDLSFISGASSPCGVALDSSSHLYWANAATNTIGRANTDGTAVDQSFVATGGNQTCGVAVDSLSSPPAPPPGPDTEAPRTTIVSGPGKKLDRGVAKFSFKSSEAGSTFRCKLDGKKTARCKSPKRYRHLKPGRHVFKVWATDASGNKDPTPAKRRFRVPR